MKGRFIAFIKLSFNLLKIFSNLIYGIWKLSKLKYAPVSIFGGTRLKDESIYIKKASQLAKMLAEQEIPVVTGGGPGIMEAANCGARNLRRSIISSVGISIRGLDPEGFNRCVETTIEMDYYFARKWLLINYSVGFVIFPGGFGTLDELMELATLIQLKMKKKVPVILIGKDYWQNFLDWIKEYPLAYNLIEEEDYSLFYITDDINEAFDILKVDCSKKEFSIN